MKFLNPWIQGALSKASRLYEDSDRKTFADRLFHKTIKRVHAIAIASAIATPDPRIAREQTDDGSVILTMEWFDGEASWHLYFSVWRKLGQKPYVLLDFSGTKTYSTDEPQDRDIQVALHDYFEAWKK